MPVYGKFTHSRLQIPLDDSGGYIELENVFLLQNDTIRISKLDIFHNCLPDSTSYSLTCYKKYPSDTGRLVILSKEKQTAIIDKNCTINYPDTIKMELNGVKRDLIMKASRKNFIICEFQFFMDLQQKVGKDRKEENIITKPISILSLPAIDVNVL